MPIPSLVAFKDRTKLDSKTHFFTSHRGKSISKIDNLISKYHGTGFHDEAGKAKALSLLLAACAHWLKEKAIKQSQSTVTRRLQIELLAREAFSELKGFKKASGLDHFNFNKGKNLQVPLHTKPLDRGYHLEREQFLNGSGKTPIQGAKIDGAFWHGQNNKEKWLSFLTKEDQKQRLRQMLEKNSWTELTLEEVGYLSLISEAGLKQPLDRVGFIDKRERAGQFLVVYKGEKADFETVAGDPYDTGDNAGKTHMFAVDSYGNLFASRPDFEAKDKENKKVLWNHSSFNAGKDVVCAGHIKIVKGALVQVDTDSGHYKPQREELYSLLKIFQEEKIDLSRTEVVFRPSKEAKMAIRMTAAAFIQEQER